MSTAHASQTWHFKMRSALIHTSKQILDNSGWISSFIFTQSDQMKLKECYRNHIKLICREHKHFHENMDISVSNTCALKLKLLWNAVEFWNQKVLIHFLNSSSFSFTKFIWFGHPWPQYIFCWVMIIVAYVKIWTACYVCTQ